MITIYNAENNVIITRPATVFNCPKKAMEKLKCFIELQIEAANLVGEINNGQCENAQEKIDAFNTKAWVFFKQG